MTLANRSRFCWYEILVTFLGLLVMASMPAGCRRAQKPTLAVTELRIPSNESDYRGLEALIVRPDDNAPHPLALMTHGTWGGAAERSQSTPLRFIPQAREFARRGWTAVIVMRRGFGDSGGIYMEDAEECSLSPNPAWATLQAAKDLREAATYLATRPEVDGSRMIGIGLSTGGLAMYAANDHFFGPQLAQQLYQAFADNGGSARFIATGPFGADGHELFSQQGAAIWTPLIDDFLLSQKLVLRDTLLPDPPPDVDSPSHLGREGQKQFEAYLLSAPHKAFATSRSGAFGFSYGQRTTATAEGKALANCNKFTPSDVPCAVVVIDDEKVP